MLALLAIMRHYDIRLDESFWQRLATHHALLQSWIEAYFLLTARSDFVLLYALAVAFSLPGALFLTLAGGAIFGWLGVVLVVVAATFGALLVFLAARGGVSFGGRGQALLTNCGGALIVRRFFGYWHCA